jgi:hypothetical protein
VAGVKGTPDLEFRVIAAAGALIGVGPAMVEDILALGMRFQITGRDPQNSSVGVLCGEMLGLPAGAGDRRLRRFERDRKSCETKGL